MELVSCETGQALQLIHMDEIRPLRGGIFLPDMFEEIKKRYRFQSLAPRTEQSPSIKFEIGVLDGIPIASFEIYTDGIAVNTRHTDDADIVMDDLIAWMLERYELREPQHIAPRQHHSRIIVDVEQSAGDLFFKNFKSLAAIVSEMFGSDNPLEVTQISFGPNPPTQYPFLRTWILQPRTGQPYVPNRYFSSAPLATTAHLEMLTRLEAAAVN